MPNKDKKPKRKRIILKPKKAREIFATAVSRGPNQVAKKNNPAEVKQVPKITNGKPRIRLSGHLLQAITKQLDGTLDFEQGTTGLWCQRALKAYGAPPKKDFDSRDEIDSLEQYREFLRKPISQEVLDRAYLVRTSHYERLFTAEEIARALLSSPVSLCFDIFKGIYKAPKGVVPMPRFWEKPTGGHCVTITGYDNNKKSLSFVNSWGAEWGDNGFGSLSYKYVKKYIIEAWCSMISLAKQGKRGRIEKRGEFDYEFLSIKSAIPARGSLYVVDVYIQDKIVGWAHFYAKDPEHFLLIEDLFVMPDYRRKGIATEILNLIRDFGLKHSFTKIVTYIHIQDLISEENLQAIEGLFKESDGYSILPYKRAFRGCVYKVIKKL